MNFQGTLDDIRLTLPVGVSTATSLVGTLFP
jgi:hypothetical protein